jgi:[acyl-carrier-protein] S-malonyltransferase
VIGFVFPGMGPYRFAEVAEFLTTDPSARRLMAIADDVLGYRLLDRMARSEGDYTEAAQIGFMVTCLAVAERAARMSGAVPGICAAPSFGARSAVCYTGSLPVAESVSLTSRIARTVHDYFGRELTDVVTHSFIRATPERLGEITTELTDRGEWCELSCRIDEDFAMVTLRERNLDWFQARLRGIGALPLYTMRPPMHSTILGALRNRIEEEVLRDFSFADPGLPIVRDHDGGVVVTGDGVRELLLAGFVKPLHWPTVVAGMKRRGVTEVYVCGPDTLFGRVAVTTNNLRVRRVLPLSRGALSFE